MTTHECPKCGPVPDRDAVLSGAVGNKWTMLPDGAGR